MNYRHTQLSPGAFGRIESLKRGALEVVQEVCVERARYTTEAYRRHAADPLVLRKAKALRHTLERMTIFIRPGEMIVGNQASRLRAAPIFPEYAAGWLAEEIDELPRRPGDRFTVPEGSRRELLRICRWWEGKSLYDRCQATLPADVKQAYAMGALSATGNMTSGDGHIMLDFPRLLQRGIGGVLQDASAALEALGPLDPDSGRKRAVLEAVTIAYQGAASFALRFADLAERMAGKGRERDEELAGVAECCRKVAEKPPETFREALQLAWFAQLISQIESNGHSMSLGRFDQYMYEFYARDRERGLLTDSQALELLCCLWIKLFEIVKIRPWAHTRFSGGGPTYQNLTLGGVAPAGVDGTNELSMLCLDSVACTRLSQPNVSVRLHSGTPPAFLRRCVEVIRLGFGMPALHNDEMMIPSLLSRGVSLADANDYAICGCIEPIIPGKHGYRAAGMSFTNFPKILEISLNGGRDPRSGAALCPQEGDLSSFASFEELWQAFALQMEHFVRLRVTGEHVIDTAIEELVPEAFCTGLVQDCIRRGKTPKEGGSVYDLVTGPETGVVNAGNALAAIRKCVFEGGLFSGRQLMEALAGNFAGAEGQRIRQILLHKAPKFGNDEDAVDQMVRDTYLLFIGELERYKTTRFGRGPIGGISYPCTATISANVPCGLPVGASADGRLAGEALSEGCSPYHGTDRLGPTAVINSVAKLPTLQLTGGNLLNQKLNPATVASEEGLRKLESLVRTFFEKKGWHIQFNVVSAETLRAAQKRPEEFRDLVVRVAGYSALFTILEPSTQEDIIARTEHTL
jgi:pyruvate formate-lyase/glycerol dehydratase family glycyl radical enzyme